jgi:Na+/glutamate symporter
MNKIAKILVLSVATFATIATSVSTASADDFHRHHPRGDGGDALAAGAIGLVAGALIGGAIANNQPRRQYIEPGSTYLGPVGGYQDDYDQDDYYQSRNTVIYRTAPRYEQRVVVRPRVVVRQQVSYSVEPWTREWFRYCSQRYRSFNPDTGTYRGYDSRDHFCTGN